MTCAAAEVLMQELINLEMDLQELGVVEHTEAAFFQLRAVASGVAKDVIELAFAEPLMAWVRAQALTLPNGARPLPNCQPGPG